MQSRPTFVGSVGSCSTRHWQLSLILSNQECQYQKLSHALMVITVALYGDLGLISRIIPNKSSSVVLYRVGVQSALSSMLLIYHQIVLLFMERCRAPSGQLDSSDDAKERRSRAHTDFLCTRCEMALLYDNYGIIGDIIVRVMYFLLYSSNHNYFQPFTNEFPRADIHELIAPDLLHQVIKGTFKDHLVTWVGELLLHIHHSKSRVNQILDDIDHR